MPAIFSLSIVMLSGSVLGPSPETSELYSSPTLVMALSCCAVVPDTFGRFLCTVVLVAERLDPVDVFSSSRWTCAAIAAARFLD